MQLEILGAILRLSYPPVHEGPPVMIQSRTVKEATRRLSEEADALCAAARARRINEPIDETMRRLVENL